MPARLLPSNWSKQSRGLSAVASFGTSCPSQAKINASRANARKSTGPSTAAGKAVSRNNAYKHGMRARNPVAPGEDQAEFDGRLAQFRDEFAPRTPSEECLVQQAADASWRRERLIGIESALLGQDDIDTVELDRISRWLVRVERSFFKAYTELQRLSKLRAETPVPQARQAKAQRGTYPKRRRHHPEIRPARPGTRRRRALRRPRFRLPRPSHSPATSNFCGIMSRKFRRYRYAHSHASPPCPNPVPARRLLRRLGPAVPLPLRPWLPQRRHQPFPGFHRTPLARRRPTHLLRWLPLLQPPRLRLSPLPEL